MNGHSEERVMATPTILVITTNPPKAGEVDALKGFGVRIIHWLETRKIRVSDYEIVVVDTRASAFRGNANRGLFKALQSDVQTLLQAGGVVFVLAGETFSIETPRDRAPGPGEPETNYDFLPDIFLSKTRLNESWSKEGSNYDAIPEWSSYFDHVQTYTKTVLGIEIGEHGPELNYGYIAERVRPIALTRATSEVIACLTSWNGGTIVILPAPTQLYMPLVFLAQRGVDLYKENVEQIRDYAKPPDWLSDFKTQQQKALEVEENELSEKLKEIKAKANSLYLAATVLFSTGRQLERAVSKIFSDFK